MNGQPDHRTSLVTIAGTSPTDLVILATLMPPVDDPEDNWSIVAALEMGSAFKWTRLYLVHAWLTSMSRSPGGRLFAVSIDGALHFGQGTNWATRNLGCPDGLMCVWAPTDDDVFAGGFKGQRGRVRGDPPPRDPAPHGR